MSHEVEFAPAARLDVVEAFDWYEQRAPGLGDAFRLEVRRQSSRIAETPHQFPVVLSEVRVARLRRFPYSLFFKVEGEKAFVIACFHASRDPRLWEGRQ